MENCMIHTGQLRFKLIKYTFSIHRFGSWVPVVIKASVFSRGYCSVTRQTDGSHLLQMSLIRTAGTAGDLVFCQFKNTSLHSLIHSVSFLSVCFSAPHISSGSAQKRQPPPLWLNGRMTYWDVSHWSIILRHPQFFRTCDGPGRSTIE